MKRHYPENKRHYLEKLYNGTETLLRLQRWPSLRRALAGKKVRIYSNEHEAYWRRDGCGYTTDLLQAGIYDFEDAWARTKHCGWEKRIIFSVVQETS